MNFDELILESAKSIMAASSALVRAANAAQRELVDQGKVQKRPVSSSDDGQWSEGLISAARVVAAATHSLVESAQNLVQGSGTEELLISSAKQVASSTAQLLIACKVKSDPNSITGRRLQEAGNAVIRSTDKLVQAAQQAIEGEEEKTLKLNRNMVDGMAQEINARSEILIRERQLEEARNKLAAIRQEKYRQKTLAGGSDSDDGGLHAPTPPPFAGYHSPSPNRQLIKPQTLPRPNAYTPPQPHSANYSNTISNSYKSSYTTNTIPRPYQPSASPETPKSPEVVSPNKSLLDRAYDTTRVENINLATSKFNRANLEAVVQNAHESIFGKLESPSPMSTFKTTKVVSTNGNPQNYEGYTTR